MLIKKLKIKVYCAAMSPELAYQLLNGNRSM